MILIVERFGLRWKIMVEGVMSRKKAIKGLLAEIEKIRLMIEYSDVQCFKQLESAIDCVPKIKGLDYQMLKIRTDMFREKFCEWDAKFGGQARFDKMVSFYEEKQDARVRMFEDSIEALEGEIEALEKGGEVSEVNEDDNVE